MRCLRQTKSKDLRLPFSEIQISGLTSPLLRNKIGLQLDLFAIPANGYFQGCTISRVVIKGVKLSPMLFRISFKLPDHLDFDPEAEILPIAISGVRRGFPLDRQRQASAIAEREA